MSDTADTVIEGFLKVQEILFEGTRPWKTLETVVILCVTALSGSYLPL